MSLMSLLVLVLALAFKANAYRLSIGRLSMSSERQPAGAPLLRALQEKSKEFSSTFFLPSHQQGRFCPEIARDALGSRAYELDLPELDGLGNVHDFAPDEDDAICQALKKAAAFMGAKRTWFLVNGSTSGVLTAMMVLRELHASRSSNNKRTVVMVTRDSHKSVFDALELANCDAWVLPCDTNVDFGISTGADASLIIESIREFQDRYGSTAELAGVIITRPTYQGVGLHSTQLNSLIETCHALQVPVVVDEAHGSHWRLLKAEDGYGGALSCGADLVIQSTHKTLGAMSQAGMLHLGRSAFSCTQTSSQRVEEVVHRYYSTFTSTSPSALLLASLDIARAHAEAEGVRLAATTAKAVAELMEEVRSAGDGEIAFLSDRLRDSRLVVDPLRLTVHFPTYPNSAVEVDDWVCEQLGIWCELNLPRCVLYCVPLGAGREDLVGLSSALTKAIKEFSSGRIVVEDGVDEPPVADRGEEGDCGVYLSPASIAALRMSVPIAAAVNMVSAENVVPYPPGIPLLLRGETIQQRHIDGLLRLQAQLGSGRYVLCSDPSLKTLSVYQQ